MLARLGLPLVLRLSIPQSRARGRRTPAEPPPRYHSQGCNTLVAVPTRSHAALLGPRPRPHPPSLSVLCPSPTPQQQLSNLWLAWGCAALSLYRSRDLCMAAVDQLCQSLMENAICQS